MSQEAKQNLNGQKLYISEHQLLEGKSLLP